MTYALMTHVFTTPKGHPVEMTYRENTNDWNTLYSSLNGDEYGLRSLDIAGRVFDVGGYLGSVGIAIAVDNPGVDVTIIEPVPANVELIRMNLASNGVTATVREGAVGNGRKRVTIEWGHRGSESLEHHAFVGNSTLAGELPTEVEHSETVYAPINLASLGPIDFMKIDAEGAEWEFLAGPTENIARIVGEVHPVRGHKPSELAGLLPNHDVTLTGDYQEAGPCGFVAVRR